MNRPLQLTALFLAAAFALPPRAGAAAQSDAPAAPAAPSRAPVRPVPPESETDKPGAVPAPAPAPAPGLGQPAKGSAATEIGEPPAGAQVAPATDAPAGDAAAGDESAAATETAAQAPPIVDFGVDGAAAGEKDRLRALLRATFPEGSRFVESGPADRLGTPLGTIPRLRKALENVGYDAIAAAHPTAGGVTLLVQLRPLDRIRYIYVDGNWPLRQDEVSRRITIRPGRTLPLAGPDRDAAIERERERLIQFLRNEGYFDANVSIDLKATGVAPAAIDLTIRISRGAPYPVGPVTVTGNTTIPSAEIEDRFHHTALRQLFISRSVQAPFTVPRLRDDMTKVTDRYREIGYPGARTSSSYDPERSIDRRNKHVALIIRVNERKRVSVNFEGNHRKSASTLRDKLTLNERGSYDDYEVGNSADALQRYYQDQGYFFARVDWRRERISNNEERIVFQIEEGPALKVRGVEFQGNHVFSSDQLSEVVTVRVFPWLGYIGLGSGGFVTARQVELDAERLVQHYRNRGYPDARATGEVSTSRETFGMIGATAAVAEMEGRTAKALYVRFTVDEGPLVRVASEEFRSVESNRIPYHPTFLRESLTMRPGDAFRPVLLREDGRRLERLLGDAGHAVATAEPDLERVGDTVRIVWKIKPGPRIRVGPIFVRGNFVTTEETILEQIPLRSGEYLTTTAFERGQRNLGFLQLFNNASPISFPGKDEGQTVVPMVVDVEERYEQYNVVHLGAGISTEQAPPNSVLPFGWYLRAGYENRNLMGHGWNLTSSVSYGQSLLRANANFLDRRFMGTLFRFDISGQYLQQATVRLGNIQSWGGSIGFAREMYPGVDAGVHYNLRNTTHTEALLRLPGASESQKNVTLSTAVGSVSFNVQWLRLDNRLVPTRGFKLEAQTEIAPRSLSYGYADVSFVKVGARSTVVIPLAPWLSLRHGLRYDQGFPMGESMLPKVERYFAGGDTTVRGFKLDRARVDVARFPADGNVEQVQYRPIGGNLRLLQNIDLQFPISPPWYGAVFWDNGVVADSLDGLAPSQVRHGVGIAPLIVKLPVGDLSFAWAWPLDPGPGDTRIGVLHVNIGLLF